jgi:hypothetical protein
MHGANTAGTGIGLAVDEWRERHSDHAGQTLPWSAGNSRNRQQIVRVPPKMYDGYSATGSPADDYLPPNAAMFTPENDLERSLVKAATDPAHRPQFYQDLVKSDVFVIQQDFIPEKADRITLEQGMELKIAPVEMNGRSYLPIFSSVARLRAVIQSEVGYIGMNALEFLKITRGAELILNPGSDYGKEFTQDEIAGILDGTIWRTNRYTVKEETQVLLGQPARYPHALADALSRLFAGKKEVQAAYLAHFFNPAVDDKSHTLIAIEATGDCDRLVAEAGMVATNVDVPDPPVDFIRMTGKAGVEDYFRKDCKPFYKARK